MLVRACMLARCTLLTLALLGTWRVLSYSAREVVLLPFGITGTAAGTSELFLNGCACVRAMANRNGCWFFFQKMEKLFAFIMSVLVVSKLEEKASAEFLFLVSVCWKLFCVAFTETKIHTHTGVLIMYIPVLCI